MRGGQTFEGWRHKKVVPTSFIGKACGEDSVIAEYHDQDTTIAALRVRETNRLKGGQKYRMRMNKTQARLKVELVSGGA